MSRPTKKLEAFNPHDYYEIRRDSSIHDAKANLVVKLRPEGVKRIIDYYAFKYGAQISRPADISEEKLLSLRVDERDQHYLADWGFLQTHGGALLKAARENQASEYRAAFIVGGCHNIPIIYMKENGKEGILYANTLASHTEGALADLKSFGERTGIPVFVVLQQSQADVYICATNALAFGKAATAKDHHQHYLTPNLLTRLLSRSIYMPAQGCFAARLPDEFLVTPQLSGFVRMHQESKGGKIHKDETLPELRGRYSDIVAITSLTKQTTTTKSIAAYARRKTLKYANLVEILFYARQLQAIAPELWTEEIHKQFIHQAKQILRQQEPVSDTTPRPGLYAFAQEFLTRLTEQAELGSAPRELPTDGAKEGEAIPSEAKGAAKDKSEQPSADVGEQSPTGDKSEALPMEAKGKSEGEGEGEDEPSPTHGGDKAKTDDGTPDSDAFAKAVQAFVKEQELKALESKALQSSAQEKEDQRPHSLRDLLHYNDTHRSLSRSYSPPRILESLPPLRERKHPVISQLLEEKKPSQIPVQQYDLNYLRAVCEKILHYFKQHPPKSADPNATLTLTWQPDINLTIKRTDNQIFAVYKITALELAKLISTIEHAALQAYLLQQLCLLVGKASPQQKRAEIQKKIMLLGTVVQPGDELLAREEQALEFRRFIGDILHDKLSLAQLKQKNVTAQQPVRTNSPNNDTTGNHLSRRSP